MVGGSGGRGVQERGSFKVVFIFVLIQVQVAVRTGDLKEVSLCQTQLCGEVLPQRAQSVFIPEQTKNNITEKCVA